MNRRPLLWAAAAAVFGFAVAFISMRQPDQPGDFLYWFTAARALLQGQSPYDVIPAMDPERFLTPFFYPLPAAVLTIPFAGLPYAIAGALFVALSSGLFAYGLARDGTERLFVLASAPFIVSAASGTWSPIIAAAALIPALGFLAVVKPNLGIASFFYRPTRWMVIGSLGLLAGSFLVRPSWVSEWLNDLGGVQNRMIPILTPVGPLLLAAASRWRRREARLLLGYALIPQAPWFYDQLILWLIPVTALEAINFTAISQVALVIWIFGKGVTWSHGSWFLAAVLYLPPLVMILRRPNEGRVPAWAERIAGRLRV